jgi:oxygen-independent coproporphyrinogen-3 oxidase
VVGTYLECISREIEAVERIIRLRGWNIETIYVGGGTPTSLNNEQLEILLKKLDETFKLDDIKEITVEAGRPDTIDEMKLRTLKKYGVNRISINPQTMNQKTLDIIGRKHSVEDIVSAFRNARMIGFDNINMDIIVGLPGEDSKMMMNTLNHIEELSPESITVHTLAIKKGSKLIDQQSEYRLPDENEVEDMMEICRKKTVEMNMIPYYLYRQKHMVGHQENIGYCLSGKECIYNIKMIEEVQNIIALGPGAVSRVIDYETGGVVKVFNDKSVEGYTSRIDEMIEKKKKAYCV